MTKFEQHIPTLDCTYIMYGQSISLKLLILQRNWTMSCSNQTECMQSYLGIHSLDMPENSFCHNMAQIMIMKDGTVELQWLVYHILGNPGVTHYVTLHSSPLGQLAYVSLSSWIINEGIWLVISVFPWEILIYFYLAYSANNVIVLCLFCEYPIISFVAIQVWY